MSVLELHDLTKVYRKGESEVRALDGVSLRVDAGEFLAVVGPSGSGKTTLLNIIGCLDAPSSGRVVYGGADLGAASQKELSAYRKDRISFIFQSYNLIPVLTVAENVELPLVIEKRHGKSAMRAKALEMLAAVGLQGMENRFPRELSGGQEQRVAIARALVKEPSVVLADEPTANLDSHTAEETVELMRRINAERGTTFVFSTHDRMVMEKAGRVVTVRDGRIVSDEKR
ncbi:MAG: lipoprotein-releasing system ATP-binding protein LolD [Spirochaetae bacterium HGW-Spirochaetae-3]|jgi:putative ABC transport system ATP-binding protein|nr:MAG: lipoprotein-releasing system ATP-binding protein LolD [Spirochaetae bacterium HGW-Spirochaetae-3]